MFNYVPFAGMDFSSFDVSSREGFQLQRTLSAPERFGAGDTLYLPGSMAGIQSAVEVIVVVASSVCEAMG